MKLETMPCPRTRFQRFRRCAFHLAALGSALLLVAIFILWPRSYLRFDMIGYSSGNTGRACHISSGAGRIEGYEGHQEPAPSLGYFGSPLEFKYTWHEWSYGDKSSTEAYAQYYRFLGVEYEIGFPHNPFDDPTAPFYHCYVITIPYSYLALLSAITPTVWLLTRKRRRREARIAHGLCPLCAYDLRGHAHLPDARCPECGTPVPSAPPG